MTDPIESKVNKWVQDGEVKFSEINLKIIHLNQWLFSDYEPCLGPTPSFLTRLAEWLDNVDDEEDQKIMFELVPNIVFIGRQELNVLYREAYQSVFAKWLIDIVQQDFTNPDLFDLLNFEVQNTWFCPLTDSLRINQFYHINNIPGKHDHRPDWRSLRTFGNSTLIEKYIEDNSIRRIVLLEDFIGNGGQISKTVQFVTENIKDIPILIIPLIICPEGVINARTFTDNHPNVSIIPVIAIPRNYFINPKESENSNALFKKVFAVAVKTYPLVANSTTLDENVDPYGPFGWKKTGGLIVMHTNTPNNTLPLIHHKSETWKPLFKRHKRI